MPAKRAPLRAVGRTESAAKRRSPAPKSVSQAAKSGTPRELLAALRDRIAKTVEDPNCPPRDLAALSRRLIEVTRDIEAIDKALEEESDSGSVAPDEEFDSSAV